MGTSDSLEEGTVLLDEWSSVTEEHGALSAMMLGITLMLRLCAISWASQEQVCYIILM